MQLGVQTALPDSPESAQIDTVPNRNPGDLFVARFTAPEFTSLCPVTGQPDFARITIDYIPGAWMIESKALKLFLGSFRNHGAFHEACTMLIKDRLLGALSAGIPSVRLVHTATGAGVAVGPITGPGELPYWFRIVALWYPRGGIPIDVFWQSGEPPTGVLIPPLPQLEYAGR